MALCLNCEEREAYKYSYYSNGKFCCIECARAYATKNNRKEISKKVSKTLTGTGNGDVTKRCNTCGELFTVPFKRRHREHCSIKCSNNSTKVQDKISVAISGVRNNKVSVMTKAESNALREARRKKATAKFDEEIKLSQNWWKELSDEERDILSIEHLGLDGSVIDKYNIRLLYQFYCL